MTEKEYKENEKVLHKANCTLSLPNKETVEAECFVTEGHVVIEAWEPIKIPISKIKNVREYSNISLTGFTTSTKLSQGAYEGILSLTFLDDLDEKQELSLEMNITDTYYFKKMIDNQVA